MNSNFRRMGRKLTIVALLAGMGLQSACTKEEAVVGAIAAFTLGAAVQADADASVRGSRRARYCRWDRGTARVGTGFDVYGNPYPIMGPIWIDSCTGNWRPMSLGKSAAPTVLSASSIDPVRFAELNKLSVESGNKVVTAMNKAATAKSTDEAIAALAEIGLTVDAIKSMATGSEPSNDVVASVSEALNQKPEDTRAMLINILRTAREEMQHSPANNGVSEA